MADILKFPKPKPKEKQGPVLLTCPCGSIDFVIPLAGYLGSYPYCSDCLRVAQGIMCRLEE